MKELEPIEVGNNMAKALLEWNKRDGVDGKDVATAVMHLLEILNRTRRIRRGIS